MNIVGIMFKVSEGCAQMKKEVPANASEVRSDYNHVLKRMLGFSRCQTEQNGGCSGLYDAPRPGIPPRRTVRFRYV